MPTNQSNPGSNPSGSKPTGSTNKAGPSKPTGPQPAGPVKPVSDNKATNEEDTEKKAPAPAAPHKGVEKKGENDDEKEDNKTDMVANLTETVKIGDKKSKAIVEGTKLGEMAYLLRDKKEAFKQSVKKSYSEGTIKKDAKEAIIEGAAAIIKQAAGAVHKVADVVRPPSQSAQQAKSKSAQTDSAKKSDFPDFDQVKKTQAQGKSARVAPTGKQPQAAPQQQSMSQKSGTPPPALYKAPDTQKPGASKKEAGANASAKTDRVQADNKPKGQQPDGPKVGNTGPKMR